MRQFAAQFCMTTPTCRRSGARARLYAPRSVVASCPSRYEAIETNIESSSRTGKSVRPRKRRSNGTSVRSTSDAYAAQMSRSVARGSERKRRCVVCTKPLSSRMMSPIAISLSPPRRRGGATGGATTGATGGATGGATTGVTGGASVVSGMCAITSTSTLMM